MLGIAVRFVFIAVRDCTILVPDALGWLDHVQLLSFLLRCSVLLAQLGRLTTKVRDATAENLVGVPGRGVILSQSRRHLARQSRSQDFIGGLPFIFGVHSMNITITFLRFTGNIIN